MKKAYYLIWFDLNPENDFMVGSVRLDATPEEFRKNICLEPWELWEEYDGWEIGEHHKDWLEKTTRLPIELDKYQYFAELMDVSNENEVV